MNKQQLKRFATIMERHGATRVPADYDGDRRVCYRLPWAGFILWCEAYAGSPDWVACKWETNTPEEVVKWRETGDYDGLLASRHVRAEAVKAAGLPYDNPFSLKWNHVGENANHSLDSLEQGLAAHPINQQKDN